MPLKHLTETVLVVLLGLMTILAGIMVDTLPLLPAGALPWAIAFGVALLYALVMYPTLKSNRAEYSFRVLHFLPALMLILWLIIQLIALKDPRALIVHYWYTFGWALFTVVTGFLLLIAFCLTVIRRRVPRIVLLLLLLVPFTGLAFASEQFLHWDQKVSSIVWRGTWWDLVGTGTFLAGRPTTPAVTDSGANLDPSANPAEEAWRRRLRALDERRREILEARRNSSQSSSASQSSTVVLAALSSSSSLASATSSSQSSMLIGQVTPPPKLPSSGFGLSGFIVMFLAGYTGVLHDRVRRRNVI